MDDLRSRTADMLHLLSDDQVALVQDYARYLRDKSSWNDAVAILSSRDPDREGHALFLRGEDHVDDVRIVDAPLDKSRMSGVGHVRHLTYVRALQVREDGVGPGRFGSVGVGHR